jgi:hypothetical protein
VHLKGVFQHGVGRADPPRIAAVLRRGETLDRRFALLTRGIEGYRRAVVFEQQFLGPRQTHDRFRVAHGLFLRGEGRIRVARCAVASSVARHQYTSGRSRSGALDTVFQRTRGCRRRRTSLATPARHNSTAGVRSEKPAACSTGDQSAQAAPISGPRPRTPIAERRTAPREAGPWAALGTEEE